MLGVIIVVMLGVIIVVMLGVIIVMAALAELDGFHGTDHLEDWHAVGFYYFDDVEEPLLKICTIDDHGRSVTHYGYLLCRGLKIMWISANRHDCDDVQLVADQVLNHVTQDVRGYNHR